MTVSELMAKLREMPPETPVVLSGFDNVGYDPLGSVERVTLVEKATPYLREGRFNEVETTLPKDGTQTFEAVVLNT